MNKQQLTTFNVLELSTSEVQQHKGGGAVSFIVFGVIFVALVAAGTSWEEHNNRLNRKRNRFNPLRDDD